MNYNPEIFKTYDIRGIYQKDFDNSFAYRLGLALIGHLGAGSESILIGHDSRDFSADLSQAIISGIIAKNSQAKYIGLATTPFFNFAFNKLKCAGGIMITASHNAPSYAGFKVYGENGVPIGLDSGLKNIREMIDSVGEATHQSVGVSVKSDHLALLNEYIEWILRKVKIKNGDLDELKFKISGSEAAMEEIQWLNQKINLSQFNKDYQVSFSFDEDADRLIVTDGSDITIRSDYLVGLLAKNSVRFLSKPKVVYDLRFSRGVIAKFVEWGVKSFKSKVGRVFVREAMIKNRADIGGELSGHIYFKETNYNELPILAMLKILKILAKSKMSLTELIRPLKTWESIDEINIPIDESQRGNINVIIEKLKSIYSNGQIEEMDGLTILYENWWFNLRPSNTEPLLRLVVEAKEKNLLEEKVAKLREQIAK